MKLVFEDFEFDSESHKLFKDGKKLSLKEKPAKVLALFLSDPEKIYSKAEILETVWPGRQVSEQVVFQNVGHLRALFGDDAIKTFSKKGYQWQLPIRQAEEQVEELVESETLASDVLGSSNDAPQEEIKTAKLMYIAIGFVIAAVFMMWYSLN